MTSIDVLGLAAATLTTCAFVPQVVSTFKTKDVSGISLPTYVIITLGLALWLIYGLLKNDLPIIVSNIFMVTFTGSICAMKLIYQGRTK